MKESDRLRERGFRLTPQRAIILETVAEVGGHQHLTAQEVYSKARERLPGLNVATVYRTLEMLHDAGLVDMMASGSSEVRFALHDPAHRHCHLVCRQCSQVLELELETVLPLAAEIQQKTGFRIDVDHLTLSGLCAHCSA